MTGNSFHQTDRYALQDLGVVFSTQAGRLFLGARDQEGVACAIPILRPPLDKKE